MFSIKQTNASGFDKIILTDTISGTVVEVIPSCGAVLHAFNVKYEGDFLNVIDNYDSLEDFKKNVSSKGFKSCKLSPFACRIKNASYVFADQKFTIEKFLLGESALHGLLYDVPFEEVGQHITDEHAGVSLLYQYKGTEAGYPFHYDCIITYLLQANNLLTISTDIINKDERAIPIQDGWHPYFTFGGKINDLLLEFQSLETIIFDDAMIPTGEKKPYAAFGSLKAIGESTFDNCFSINFAECQPMCVLRDKTKKLQLEIRPDKSYPYLQIYTPDHRNSIAIENLSAVPDTYNNGIGLTILLPKEKANFTTSYNITSLT